MTKISELSDGGTLQSTDELIVVRSGGNARAKINTLPDMTVSQSPSVPSSSAQIFYNSIKGAVLRGQGSTSDVTLENDAGQTALKVPTGTQRVDVTSLTVTNDVAVGSVTANSTLDVTGSTGIYQRHSSGGSIVLDDSDTADASSPMVYLRNTAGQLRLGGANRNATTKRTTGSVDYVTLDSGGMTLSTTINNTFSSTIPWNTYTGDTLVLKNLAGQGTDDYVAINMATSGAQTAAMRHILKAESNGDGNYYWQFRDTADVSNTTTRMQYTSDGDLTYYPLTATTTVFNSDAHDHDVQFKSDSLSHLLHVNGGANAVSVGGTGSDKRLNVYHTTNSTTGVHIENLDSGTSARASLALRSDGGFLYFFATSQAYSGVASWQDAAVIANSSSLAGGIVVNSQAGGITLQDSTVSRLEIVPNSELVINQSGIDRDFRVETDNFSHGFMVDASLDSVGIGTSLPQGVLDLGNAPSGRGIAWGGTGGTAHYTTIWSEYSSASLILGSGLKGSTTSATFLDPHTGTYGYAAIELDSFSDDGIKFYAGADAARTKDATITPNEHMRLTPSGRLGLGITSPAVPLHVVGPADTNVCIIDATGTPPNYILSVRDDNSAIFQVKRAEIVVNESSSSAVDFRVESDTSTHALFIDSSSGSGAGVIHFNGTSQTPYTQTTGAGQLAYRLDNGSAYGTLIQSNNAANGWSMMYCNKYAYQSGYDRRYIVWYVNGGALATLQLNAAGTQVEYNTSSDRRLKDNIVDIDDGITRLKQLKPRSYKWVGTDFNAEGFIADEADGIVPEAVKGEVNAVDDEGNPVYQQIEYAKYVPLITAALQESITKIENLETRLSNIEN